MIRVHVVVPEAERYKTTSRDALERAGIIAELEAQMTLLNPDWRDHHPEIGVAQTVQSNDVAVAMTADCDPAPRAIAVDPADPVVVEGAVLERPSYPEQVEAVRGQQQRYLAKPAPDLTMARSMINAIKLADEEGCGVQVLAGWVNNVRLVTSAEVPKGEVWLMGLKSEPVPLGQSLFRCTGRYRVIGYDETAPSYTLQELT